MEAATILQSREKVALMAVGGLVFMLGGTIMLNDPDGSRRYSPEFVHAVGAITILFFGACSVAAVAQLLCPSRLIISPEGLTYEWLWRRQTWPWKALGPFEIEGKSTSRMIRFDVAENARRPGLYAARPAIPGGWRQDLAEVCRRLNEARERWR